MKDRVTAAVQDYLKAIHMLGGVDRAVLPVDIAQPELMMRAWDSLDLGTMAVACGCWHLFSRSCHHRHLRYRTQGMEIRARQMGNSGRRRRLGAASAVCG